jgi:hypothetical protein
MNLNVFKQLAQLFETKAANTASGPKNARSAQGLGTTAGSKDGLQISQAKFIEFLKAKGVDSLDEGKLKALMAEHLGVKEGFIDKHGLQVSVQFSKNLLQQAEQEGIHFNGSDAELSEEVVGKRVNRQQTRAKGKKLAEQEAQQKNVEGNQNGQASKASAATPVNGELPVSGNEQTDDETKPASKETDPSKSETKANDKKAPVSGKSTASTIAPGQNGKAAASPQGEPSDHSVSQEEVADSDSEKGVKTTDSPSKGKGDKVAQNANVKTGSASSAEQALGDHASAEKAESTSKDFKTTKEVASGSGSPKSEGKGSTTESHQTEKGQSAADSKPTSAQNITSDSNKESIKPNQNTKSETVASSASEHSEKGSTVEPDASSKEGKQVSNAKAQQSLDFEQAAPSQNGTKSSGAQHVNAKSSPSENKLSGAENGAPVSKAASVNGKPSATPKGKTSTSEVKGSKGTSAPKSNVSREQKSTPKTETKPTSAPKMKASDAATGSNRNGISWNQGKIKGHQYLGLDKPQAAAKGQRMISPDKAELTKEGLKAQQQQAKQVVAEQKNGKAKAKTKTEIQTKGNASAKSQTQATSGADKLSAQQKAAQSKSNGNANASQVQGDTDQGKNAKNSSGSASSGSQSGKQQSDSKQQTNTPGKTATSPAGSNRSQGKTDQEPRLAMDTKRSEIASDRSAGSSNGAQGNGEASAAGSAPNGTGEASGTESAKMSSNGTIHAANNAKAAHGKADAMSMMFRNDAAATQFARQELPSKIVQVVQRYPVRSQAKDGQQWHRHRIIMDKGEALNLAMQKSDGTLQVHISTGNAEMTRMLQQHLQQIKAHLQEQLNMQVDVQLQQDPNAEAQSGFQEQLQERGANGQESGGSNSLGIEADSNEGASRSRRPRMFGFNNNEWTG